MATDNNSVLARNTVQYDISGLHDPTLIATKAAPGSTYRKLSIPPKFYIKLDEGETVNWLDISGFSANGINLGTGAQILKNVIANTLYFRSLKSNSSQIVINQAADEITFGFNSNEIITPVELTTNSASFETLWLYDIPLNHSVKIMVKVVGRKADGTERSYFERIGLYYNETGNAQIIKQWQTSSTFKTDNAIDIRYLLIGSVLQIQVKSLNTDTYFWKGQIYQINLNTL